MFPGSIGYQELIVIAVIAVILFGGRLPEVARTIGSSYQQFRKGLADLQSSINSDIDSSAIGNTESQRPDYSDVDSDLLEPVHPQFEPPNDDG